MLFSSRFEAKGFWLAVLAIAIFAMTLPLTRLAVGTDSAPQLSGLFVATARACLAAAFSGLFLWLTRAPWPSLRELRLLVFVAIGVVFGFPVLISVAMRHVQAVHASVILGVLPLATAVAGAWLNQQRPSPVYWLCAITGATLVILFSLTRHLHQAFTLAWADVLLILGMVCAAGGYALGALLSSGMRPEHVICWALVISLPLNIPIALSTWPDAEITTPAWIALLYLALFSQWLGFFAWYRALSIGGTVRTSQVQLLQPFLSMLFAWPILGEQIDALSLGFSLAVIAVVFLSRQLPVHK